MRGDMVDSIVNRRPAAYSNIDGYQYQYKVTWKGQGITSAQWVHPNAIKLNGKQHPQITAYNRQHPFTGIPKPGDKEPRPQASSSTTSSATTTSQQ
jgi:hypothetical protein